MTGIFTRRQAAEYLAVCTETIDIERAAGRLSYIQRGPGCKVWITQASCDEWLARHEHRALPATASRPTLRRRRT